MFIAGLGLVRSVSGGSAMAAATLFVCRLLPFALLSPIAGAFADRFSRRQLMIWTDLIRGLVAFAFLFVHGPTDLWIAYSAMAVLSGSSAFFEGAKNAATPNLTGANGLLAGTALMFSTRFLLMAVGSALGGVASVMFGYDFAFIINGLSFFISAYTVWLIPEESTRDSETAARQKELRPSIFSELKEGVEYTIKNRFAFTILLINIIWALGGGAINMVFERLGGTYFAQLHGLNPDNAVALMWVANGLGLFIGMMIAHRVDGVLGLRKARGKFIGWGLIIHGLVFAVGGLMPSILLFCVFCLVSRIIVGTEYAVQETVFQKSLPDYIRGRISTLDRGAEITTWGLASYLAGLSTYIISEQSLTVISGIIAALSGVIWFMREGSDEPQETPSAAGRISS